jgi:uncharacterized protein YjiS (DUF1127 family)
MILDTFRDLKSMIIRHKAYKQTYRELSGLTDRELNDIGLNRGMIKSIAMEAYLDAR